MTETNHPVNETLRALEPGAWSAPDHQRRLEHELTSAHRRLVHRPFLDRHRTAIIGVLLLVMAGGIGGATYAWYTKANQYTFEIRRHGEVLTRPRIIVYRGQPASLTITGGSVEPSFTILVHYDGSTTIIGPPDVEVDVEVVEIDLEN